MKDATKQATDSDQKLSSVATDMHNVSVNLAIIGLPSSYNCTSLVVVEQFNYYFRSLFKRAICTDLFKGYLKEYISFAKLSIDVSHDLFLKAQSPNHCLNHLLPVCRPLDTLRPRGHKYFLPEYCTELHKRSFIINTLYRFV